MSKKILAVLLCLSLLCGLFTMTVSADSDKDNEIGYDRLDKEGDVELVAIELTTPPTKLSYVEGEELDLTGGVVSLTYDDDFVDTVTLSEFEVTGYNKDQIGEQTLTVSYEGKTTTFVVNVVAKAIVSIKITTPASKLTFVAGDKLDTAGLVVTAVYNNNSEKAVTGWTAAADLSACGTKTVTVTYEGKTATYQVTVNHKYAAATCDKPQTCKCGATIGKANGHKASAATCTADSVCSVCKKVLAAKKGHSTKTTTSKATLSKDGSIVTKCTVCGTQTAKTTIKKIKTVKLSTTSYTYNGKAKKPAVSVKDSAGKTISSKNYTVKYAGGCKNVGTYKVTVTFKGNYSGTKTLTFKINPPKTTVKSLTAAKKSLKVSITKKSSQVTGYEVQYSTSKKFTKATTKTVKSYKTTSYTIKSLSAKKNYYVRVRTYKTVSGKKYYSAWSTAKYKKTK